MTSKAPRRSAARRPRRTGLAAEALAESFLVREGYLPLARNHVARGGELDLVVSKGDLVVFVEVKKARRGAQVGPLERVTPVKQARLVRAAMDYVLRAGLDGRALRFDVIAVLIGAGQEPEFVHVEAAFDASAGD